MVLPLLVLLGLTGVGLAFLVLGVRRVRRVRTWPRVGGQVLGSERGFDGGDRDGLSVRYPVVGFLTEDGQHVVARSGLGDSVSDWSPGRRVAVRYDPADPQRFAVEGFAHGGGLHALVGGVLALFGGTGLTVLALTRL